MPRRLTTLIGSLLAIGTAAATLSLALNRFGINESAWQPRAILHWILPQGVNLAIIVVGTVIVIRAATLAIGRLQIEFGRGRSASDLESQRRAATLGEILTSLVTAIVGFVAILMVLRELSIDVVPILTGAGIAGLAGRFRPPNPGRHEISRFFLILEDPVRIGDLARIKGLGQG